MEQTLARRAVLPFCGSHRLLDLRLAAAGATGRTAGGTRVAGAGAARERAPE